MKGKEYDFAVFQKIIHIFLSPYLTQAYDGNGNRVKKQGVQRLGDLCQPSAVTYQYDVRGQLLEERRVEDSKDETTLYRYDAAGNRVRKSSTLQVVISLMDTMKRTN